MGGESNVCLQEHCTFCIGRAEVLHIRTTDDLSHSHRNRDSDIVVYKNTQVHINGTKQLLLMCR